jgi:endonuclease/exonuclease/phosphatase (EEP) superfamily protein YafD
VRYRLSDWELVRASSVALVDMRYGWHRQIRGVHVLVAEFTDLVVATIHAPAHTGRTRVWLTHTEQARTSTEAYKAMLEALPGLVDDLRGLGKPILFTGDWNKPLRRGYWRRRLERTMGLRLSTHSGVTGSFVSDLAVVRTSPRPPVEGFDHDPWFTSYRVLD